MKALRSWCYSTLRTPNGNCVPLISWTKVSELSIVQEYIKYNQLGEIETLYWYSKKGLNLWNNENGTIEMRLIFARVWYFIWECENHIPWISSVLFILRTNLFLGKAVHCLGRTYRLFQRLGLCYLWRLIFFDAVLLRGNNVFDRDVLSGPT